MRRRLDPDGLHQHLQHAGATLAPLYVVTGDESLLVIEALDALRAAAAAQGYTERSRIVLDARSDWSAVLGATQNVSLFGDRKLLDLSLPSGKPGRTGRNAGSPGRQGARRRTARHTRHAEPAAP